MLNVLDHELKTADSEEKINLLKIEINKIKLDMTEIENAVNNYKNQKHSDERLFLRCRYIDGYTIEKTAAVLNISRDTAYRINRRVKEMLIIK